MHKGILIITLRHSIIRITFSAVRFDPAFTLLDIRNCVTIFMATDNGQSLVI